jgi:hypothetical protein
MEDQVSYNIMEQCPFTGRIEVTDWQVTCPGCMDFVVTALSAFGMVIGSCRMDHPVNNNIFQFLMDFGKPLAFKIKRRKLESLSLGRGKGKGGIVFPRTLEALPDIDSDRKGFEQLFDVSAIVFPSDKGKGEFIGSLSLGKGKGKGGEDGDKGKGEFKRKFKDKGEGQPVGKASLLGLLARPAVVNYHNPSGLG